MDQCFKDQTNSKLVCYSVRLVQRGINVNGYHSDLLMELRHVLNSGLKILLNMWLALFNARLLEYGRLVW
jgi:hypothetical protein